LQVHILNRDKLIRDARYLNALLSEFEQGLSQVVQGVAICIWKLTPDLLFLLGVLDVRQFELSVGMVALKIEEGVLAGDDHNRLNGFFVRFAESGQSDWLRWQIRYVKH